MQATADTEERPNGLLGDVVAWDGRQMVVLDPDVIENRLRREKLSPSTAKAMSTKSCVARWAGEKLMPKAPENPFDAAPLGTGGHAILEDMYQLDAELRTLDTYAVLLEKQTIKQFPVPEDGDDADKATAWLNQVNWKAAAEYVSKTIFALEDPKTVNVYGCETQIDAMIDGVPTNGYIDRLDIDENGNVRIVDYKTGKVKTEYDLRYGDDHGDQLRVYALALHQMMGKMPASAALYYTNGKGPIVRKVSLEEKELDRVRQDFTKAWKRHNRLMKSGRFSAKVSALCGWCPLVASCPAAIAEGKVDRTGEKTPDKKGVLPTAEELGIRTLSEIQAEDQVASDVVAAVSGTATGAPSAHIGGEEAQAGNGSEHTPERWGEEDEMSANDAPWIEYDEEGNVKPTSYRMGGGFGLTSMAMDVFQKSGAKLTPARLHAVTSALGLVAAKAQRSWTGTVDLHSQTHVRIRGALRSVLDSMPFPIEGTVQEIKDWMNRAGRRVKAIVEVSVDLAVNGPDKEPWLVLGSDAAEHVEPVAREETYAIETEPAQAEAKHASKQALTTEPQEATVPDFGDIPALDFPDED